MIIDEIRKANVLAMKEKNAVARGVFSILLDKAKLCEINKRGTENPQLTDADVSGILQKMMKELEEEKAGYEKAGNEKRAQEIAQQQEIVKKFLPQMMSEEEIRSIVASLSDTSLPAVMKHFKANYAGKCDMRLVQQIAKETR